MEIISKSEKDTFDVAASLVEQISPGTVLALNGDLGSGKTTFVKGLAKALGITREITSPTFVISKEYKLPENSNFLKLVHIDAYRLSSKEDAESVGISDYLNSKTNLTVIEWPENINQILNNYEVKKITFEYQDESTRRITIS